LDNSRALASCEASYLSAPEGWSDGDIEKAEEYLRERGCLNHTAEELKENDFPFNEEAHDLLLTCSVCGDTTDIVDWMNDNMEFFDPPEPDYDDFVFYPIP